MHGDSDCTGTLKKPYFYNIFMVYNKILLLILVVTALLLLISGGNIMLFVGATFWTNFLEGIINRITFIVFVLLFKP